MSGVRCANSWGLGPCGPSLLQGGALLLFPVPMDEVHGIEFFFGVMSVEFTISGHANPHPGQLFTILLTALDPGKLWGLRPQTPLKINDSKPSLLPACREQQGGKEKRKAWGLCPQTPLKIKDSKPSLLPACREQQGGKEKRKSMGAVRPQTPLKIKDSKPSLLPACREQQGGKEKRKSMGAVRPQPPNQEQSSWTSSVGSPHIGHDTSWRHSSSPKTSWAATN